MRIGASFSIMRAIGDALPLAARQLDAALADLGVVTSAPARVGDIHDEIMRRGAPRRILDLGLRWRRPCRSRYCR